MSNNLIITSIFAFIILLNYSCSNPSSNVLSKQESENKQRMNDQDHVKHNSETEKLIQENVDKYGFHIAYFESEGYLPAFVYTIGLYQNYKHPEIMIFGLKDEVMGHLLHGFVEKIKEGIKFNTSEDYNGYLANFPIRFLSVHKDHYSDYLGYCGWYYNQTFNFPAYQMIWTDKEGNYPWDQGFYKEWKFKQPLLDRNTNFKFYEERNLGVYTTKHTLDGYPILWVYHNKNGDWQFHSEEYPETDNAKIVTLEELVMKDPTLNDIYFLNYGQSAIREDVNSDWEIFSDDE